MILEILSDEFVLEQATRSFHWNVDGTLFEPLHSLFGTQYGEIGKIIDDMAETMRQDGDFAPDHVEMTKLATLDVQHCVGWEEMVQELYRLHEEMKVKLNAAIPTAEDEAVRQTYIDALKWHKKQCWKLGMHLHEEISEPEGMSGGEPAENENEITEESDADIQQEDGAVDGVRNEAGTGGGAAEVRGDEDVPGVRV